MNAHEEICMETFPEEKNTHTHFSLCTGGVDMIRLGENIIETIEQSAIEPVPCLFRTDSQFRAQIGEANKSMQVSTAVEVGLSVQAIVA